MLELEFFRSSPINRLVKRIFVFLFWLIKTLFYHFTRPNDTDKNNTQSRKMLQICIVGDGYKLFVCVGRVPDCVVDDFGALQRHMGTGAVRLPIRLRLFEREVGNRGIDA